MIFTFDWKLEPRDAWVGLFWDKRRFCGVDTFHVYVCPLPFLVFHWTFKDVSHRSMA